MILIGSDNAYQLIGLQNAITGDYIDDATVTASVATLDGSVVFTMSGTYLDGTDGNYLVVITADQTAELAECTEYTITITAASGGSQKEWQENQLAIIGGFNE